jgi:hypothetical protein
MVRRIRAGHDRSLNDALVAAVEHYLATTNGTAPA